MKIKLLHPIGSLIFIIFLITINSCQTSFVRPIVYEPKESSDVALYYFDGNPVAELISEDKILQASVTYSKLTTRDFIRVWVNYTNLTDKPELIDPMKSFILHQYRYDKRTEKEYSPQYPYIIVSRLQREKQNAILVNAFIGILEAASTTATVYYHSSGDVIVKNDLQEKLNMVYNNSALRADMLRQNFDQLVRDVNTIFLKKNTVFPNQSISGFIFFEIEKGTELYYKAKNYAYVLKVNLPSIDHKIQFLPVEGD